MTIRELQNIVLKISNQEHVRWWAHWNHPQESPWLMAISVRIGGNFDKAILFNRDMKAKGFRRQHVEGLGWLFFVERSDVA